MLLPNQDLETLRGAHWLPIENPVPFNAIVREWLRNLDLEHVTEPTMEHVRPADEL